MDRRRLIGSGLAMGAAAASAPRTAGAAPSPFRHGVASGEPGADRMLLWTRVSDAGEARGTWRVASDPQMRRIVARGRFTARADRDFTVKVEVRGLKPGTDYWYRFDCAGASSPVGRTRTLTVGRLEELNLALACCAMFTMGRFHGYRAMAAREQLDAVLFVGDYIYEYGASTYPGLATLRPADPPHDTLTLDDYRRRFAQARTDLDLQAAHARAPWICTWDDHEISNDDWTGGAQGHAERQGDWEIRKAAAVRAWYEWMPVRDPHPADPYAIQRAVAFGDLATLIVPETRLKARGRQLSIPRDLEFVTGPDGTKRPDIEGFRRKIADPGRAMLGEQQLAWIEREMTASVAAGRPWALLGSATIMGDYDYPDMSDHAPADGTLKGFFEMTKLGLPLLNLDAWSGYGAERARLHDIIRRSGAKALVLSGDSHMAFANALHDGAGQVALELGATTISGPSLGVVLAMKDAPLGERLAAENRDIAWCDHLAVGFVAVRLTRETAEAQFVEVVDPRGDDASVRVVREASARAGEPWTFATESSPSPPVSTPKRPPRSTTAGRPRP